MGAFNLIETFFFLTLGITFALIILLVYHFKKRISTMEQKSDTMFDIVQNVAKEIIIIKNECMSMKQPPPFPFASTGYNPFMGNMMNMNMNMSDMVDMNNVIFEVNDLGRNKCNEKKVEEIDEDGDSDQEEDDEDSDDSSDDDIEDIDTDTDADEIDTSKKIIIIDDVKIINLNEKLNLSEIHEIDENTLEFNAENDTEPEQKMIEITEPEQILVNKLNETESNLVINPTSEDETTILYQMYSAMSVPELKKTVIAKGLCSSASKLKKDDLMKLLMDSASSKI